MSFLKTCLNKRVRYLPCFFALALVGADMLIPAPAQAAGCSALMGDIKAGNLYAVSILKGKDKGQVEIETLKGSCLEPIEKWKSRGLPMASLGRGLFITTPKNKKKTYTPPPTGPYSGRKSVPPPSGEYKPAAPPASGAEEGSGVPPGGQAKSPAGPAETPGEEATPKPPVRPLRKGRCDRVIGDFWGPGKINVKGSTYRLSGAFTVDLDGDGWVDNVDFKLKVTGRVGDVIRYFDAPGRLSGQTIPDLKIANDNDISRLCPGNVTFKSANPGEQTGEEQKVAKNEIEILKEAAKGKPKKKKKGLSGIALAVFSGAGAVLFISGIVILFLLKPEFAARLKKKKEAKEDGEEDEKEKKS